jgi:hypothetical protein
VDSPQTPTRETIRILHEDLCAWGGIERGLRLADALERALADAETRTTQLETALADANAEIERLATVIESWRPLDMPVTSAAHTQKMVDPYAIKADPPSKVVDLVQQLEDSLTRARAARDEKISREALGGRVIPNG